MTYSIVDLFAGAGGLSLGFLETKEFAVKAFVENNKNARETYLKNHADVKSYENVIGLDYAALIQECGKIDVVVGGPPCQGFSNANRQRNQLINMNNQLVKEYVRAICELQPKVFVMENVKMLKSDVHMFYYTEEDKQSGLLEKNAVPLKDVELSLLSEDAASEELYQACCDAQLREKMLVSESAYSLLTNLHRYIKNLPKLKTKYEKSRENYLAVCKELSSKDYNGIPDSLHENYLRLSEVIQEYGTSISSDALIPELVQAVSIQNLLRSVSELTEKKIVFELVHEKGIKANLKSYSVCDYIRKTLSSAEYNYKITQGILNAAEFGAPQKRQRFIMIGVRDGQNLDVSLPKGTFTEENFRTVRDAIEDLEALPVEYDVTEKSVQVTLQEYEKDSLQSALRDSENICNHITTRSREVALSRFAALKQGENFHNLSLEMKENTYTDISRTQNTIYQRLNYDAPSGTVLNVRKSMWIHPTLDRAVSIREAARLQTFPDSYVFCGSKDAQYQQIGNAVPPILGRAIAEKILELLAKTRRD